jgi:hypothetical protein
LTAASGVNTIFIADNSAASGTMTCKGPTGPGPTANQVITVKWFGWNTSTPTNGPTFNGNGVLVEQANNLGKVNIGAPTTSPGPATGDAITWVYDGVRWVVVQ